jgi:hypothetical protein
MASELFDLDPQGVCITNEVGDQASYASLIFQSIFNHLPELRSQLAAASIWPVAFLVDLDEPRAFGKFEWTFPMPFETYYDWVRLSLRETDAAFIPLYFAILPAPFLDHSFYQTIFSTPAVVEHRNFGGSFFPAEGGVGFLRRDQRGIASEQYEEFLDYINPLVAELSGSG